MYRCNDCGKIFENPKAVEESRGEYWGMPAHETVYYCPHCESEDYDEFDGCDEAGILNELEVEEYIDEDYLAWVTYTSDWYYDNCHGKCAKCKFYKDDKCMWEAWK